MTGDFTPLVKDGLSILIINSQASKKGFLKSIGGGLLAVILKGPLGWGKVVYPLSMQTYYPASGELITSWLMLSVIVEGSNLILTNASTPSKLSEAGTTTVGVYKIKSEITTGCFAFGSTLTGAF